MRDRARHIGLPVLRLLADGRRRSGQELADALGVSRAAVWKQIKRLEALGLGIDARRGSGYRIDPPLDVLDAATVRATLAATTRDRLHALEVMAHVESTNTRLFAAQRPASGLINVCLAEYQTAGRGRHARTWLAPPGRGLCLSVAWVFAFQPEGIEALGLAAGVVARRALMARTGLPIYVKWPNDLIVADRKLGGILVELSAEGHGPCYVVTGVGINVSDVPRLPPDHGSVLSPVDLATAMQRRPPSRNALAAALIDAFAELSEGYAAMGFGGYHAEIVDADYLRGRSVTIDTPTGPLIGHAAGIGADGRLLLDQQGRIREIVAGEVSVRSSS